MQDLTKLAATEAARLISAGRLRPVELMEACLARIAEREPAVRAFAWFDVDAARRGATNARPGALHGVPIGVKDVLDTADMPSEYGSPIWRGWRPRADAAAVAWARHAGAVVVGKTVTTEFATRKPGPTGNPHNLKHTPGGSSSGSAAGVADGFFPLALWHPDRGQRDPAGGLLWRGGLQAELRDDQPVRHEIDVGKPRYCGSHGP